jgi:hypothetical protein
MTDAGLVGLLIILMALFLWLHFFNLEPFAGSRRSNELIKINFFYFTLLKRSLVIATSQYSFLVPSSGPGYFLTANGLGFKYHPGPAADSNQACYDVIMT